jgi:hypothetical protein
MRTPTRQRHRRISDRTKRLAVLIAGGLAIVFILVNIVLGILYRDRTYPRTSVTGTSIGSHSYDNLSEVIQERDVLPSKLTLKHGSTERTVSLESLGISKEVSRTVDSAKEQRSWLPIFNLFKSPTLRAPVEIDQDKLNGKVSELAKVFAQNAANAHLKISDGKARIIDAKDGYKLDTSAFETALLAGLDDGETTIEVPTSNLPASVRADKLDSALADLNDQLATKVTFTYNGQTKQPTPADRGQWYLRSGERYALSREMVQAYVTRTGQAFGINVKGVEGVVTRVMAAMEDKKTVSIALSKQTLLKTYRFCTAVRGVDQSAIPSLQAKLQDTYGDPRGWSIDGQVAFREVSSGCEYTVWLSSSDQMTSFGGVCDPVWSCRSENNVVLNYTRWMNASPAWNANGGTLDQYRDMLINHETGHWLGFRHRFCGGAGQSAPVMQQQSIDLQGCTFSAWPNADERATLKRSIGL